VLSSPFRIGRSSGCYFALGIWWVGAR
jgi:hypothetical protein